MKRRPARGRGGPAIAALLGALAGLLFVAVVGSRFATPAPLDPDHWNVTSAAMRADVTIPGLGRGTHVVDGTLVIRQHVFNNADMVSPKDTRPFATLEIALAPGDGVARVMLKGDGQRTPVQIELTADRYMTPDGRVETRDDAGPWRIAWHDGRAMLEQSAGPVFLGAIGPGTFEITAASSEVAFTSLRAVAADGQTIADEDFTKVGPGVVPYLVGAVAGALAGLLARVVARKGHGREEGAFAAGLLLLPPLLVATVPPSGWLMLVERLYLVKTPAWDLACYALAASFAPLVVVAALRSGLLVPREGGADAERAWIGTAVAAALLASRELSGWGWLGIVPGLAFALLPLRVARLARLDRKRSFAADAPALLALALFGWTGGSWLALAWRAVVLAASARVLLDRAPRAAADLLSVLLLAAPASCELAARGTYLRKAWDVERLTSESAPTKGWRDPEAFWAGSCGPESAAHAHAVLFAGGSSTGGAYQFKDEPEAFFAAQAHRKLCAELPPDTKLTSTNHGGGGRDTFTISRTIDLLMDRSSSPDVVVLYTGVNDLAGGTNSKTRKEREAEEKARGEALTGALGIAMHSRVLTGLSLWVRPLQQEGGKAVADVPIPDAEENIRMVAAAAAARHATLLLVTEYATAQMAPLLGPYAQMEAKLAGELPGVEWFDLRAALAGTSEQELLVDANHLSREGSVRVGGLLADRISAILGLPQPVASPVSP